MKNIISLFTCLVVIFLFTSCGSKSATPSLNEASPSPSQIVVVDETATNSSTVSKVGTQFSDYAEDYYINANEKYSVCKVDEELDSLDNAADWYFNYVLPNVDDYNYFLVILGDTDGGYWAIDGCISAVEIESDSSGVYACGESLIDYTIDYDSRTISIGKFIGHAE